MSVTLKCKHCHEECVRSDLTGQWVHVRDEVTVKLPSIVVIQNWDHEAEPDVIEANTAPLELDYGHNQD